MSFTKTKYDFCNVRFQDNTNKDIYNMVVDTNIKTETSQINQMDKTGVDFRNNIIQTKNTLPIDVLDTENKLIGISQPKMIQQLPKKNTFVVVPFNSL